MVMLDVKEKVFAPKATPLSNKKVLTQVFKVFDQPHAMKKIKEAMGTGRSAAAIENLPTTETIATHTEL